VALLRRIPPSVYERLKRAPVVAPLFRRALDVLIVRSGSAPTAIEGGPLKEMTLELDPRTNKDMIVGRFEPEVMAALESLLEPGALAFDVGAHLGYGTLVMAAAAGASGRIWSFEPDPEMFATLQRNIDGNRDERSSEVISVRAALGTEEGRASFVRGETTGTGRLGTGAEVLDVEVTTLDAAAARYGTPAVIKIDVEGGELNVLRGGTKLLEQGRTSFVVEAHSPDLDSECRSLLERFGYDCEELGAARVETTHFIARARPR
jgi:FkbM family methyltransferase